MSHMATHSRKKLLVILGAGSSRSQGMPSVEDIDGFMKNWSNAWALGLPGYEDYFIEIWNGLIKHYSAAKPALRRQPNFEVALGEMIALAHWMNPAPYGDPLREIAYNGATPTGFKFAFPSDPWGNAATTAIKSQITCLLNSLAQHMRQQCISFNPSSPEFRQYCTIVQAIRNEFDVGIYNLNYDTIAHSAMPGAHTGFDALGEFDPKSVHGRSGWDFVYHLHGSVHCTLVGPFGESMRWQNNLLLNFDDGKEGRSSDERSGGRQFPRTTLIAGGFKLDQILVEPFQSFYAAMVRHVHEADAILIGGYGFGDEHVNRALQNRLERAGNRPPVAVLTWSDNPEDPMQLRSSDWSYNLHRALHARNQFREPGSSSVRSIEELKMREGFEVCSNDRVAIWHGGFVEASGRINELSKWLATSAGDDVLAGR